MSIEFRARWSRPRALVISLCGTNVVVLSDSTRKEDGRGVHIFQAIDLARPDLFVPDELRGSVLKRKPQLLAGEALRHRYFRFEPDRWYRVRFVKGDRLASLFVDDRLVLDAESDRYGAMGQEISLITWSPMEIDEIRITGTVDPAWYSRHVIRGR